MSKNQQNCGLSAYRDTGDDDFDQAEKTSVYLLLKDDQPAAQLASELEKCCFRTQRFTTPADLEDACRMARPGVILMDEVVARDETTAAAALRKLGEFCKPLPPAIFIAERDDMQARLAAHRAGVSRYFVKPVDNARLIETLNVIALEKREPARILVVTDKNDQAQNYSAMLKNAGMDTHCISDPFKVLESLEAFRPELVLLDTCTHDCNSLELVAVIRQDDAWAHVPIVSVTDDIEPNWQLDALRLGADGLISKPVKSAELVDALQARLKQTKSIQCLDERRREALLESSTLRTALDQHDIVSITDAAGIITHANDKFCEVSGYSCEELIGRNHNILNSGYHPNDFFGDLWRTIKNGKVWHGEICNRRKNGSHYWVMSTMVPFLNAAGQPYQYVSLRTDITMLRANEERLHRSQVFANIGTWDWNIETGDLYWSERIGPLFGYGSEVPETSYENFLAAVHPDDRQQVTDAVNACVQQGADYNIEHRVLMPDGTVRWLQERGDVVRDKDGKPLHMLGVVQDISDRKAAETNSLIAREEAEHANRAKSQFLSSMSHELRTPMNAILGFTQLLELEALTEEQQESVEEISRAGHHLLELINEVLDLSKIEAGHIDLSIEAVGLSALFQECRALINPFLDKYQVTLNYFTEPCGMLMVRADHTRLKQAFLNLLSNACKYNRTGGTVTVECSLAEDEWIRVSIRDTGSGIPAELLDKLFLPFNRLGAESSDIEGTGIGLVITRQLIELMGGRVGVDSQVGEGSTFWVELPLDENTTRPEAQSSCVDKSMEADVDRLHTVLYLEDNLANLRLVSRLLARRPNIHLLTAHDSRLGLDLAEVRRPDLILLDINMPDMNGYEVLARLRAKEVGRSIPILAVSANAMPRDVERGIKAGFDAYLTKPLDVEVFLKAVDEHLVAGSRSCSGVERDPEGSA